MAILSPVLRQRFFDSSGNPLAGGLLWSYAAGTSTPLVTYNQSGAANTNPVQLDSSGYADVWLSDAAYKLVLTAAGGDPASPIWSVDSVTSAAFQANGFTGPIGQTTAYPGTFTALTAKSVGGVQYADQFAGADIGEKINAAIAALPAGGGEVVIPAGSYSYSTLIAITSKPVYLHGQGTGTNNFASGATVLIYTGSAQALTVNQAAARGTVLADFTIANTGTGTIGLDIYQTLDIRVERVTVWPSVAFSTAGINIGRSGTAVSSITFLNVYSRANVVGLKVQNLNAHLSLIDSHFVQNTTNDFQIGDLATTAIGIQAVNCTFEGLANTTSVNILRVAEVSFLGCYFENDGTGYAIDIPNTAVTVKGVSVHGGIFSGTAWSNATTYAIDLNASFADIEIFGAYFFNYANPSFAVRNQSSMSIVGIGVKLDATGMTFASSATGVIQFGNVDSVGTQSVTQAAPVTYNSVGVQQVNTKIVSDITALTAGSATVTLTGAAVFTGNTTYQVTAADVTSASAVKIVKTSGSQFTITGTGGDIIGWIAVGN